jgi:predicted metal-dependent HD superfamily phosphohydrolase
MSKQLFRDLISKISPKTDDKLAWTIVYDLFSEYNPDKRFYHTIDHIYQCITDLKKLAKPLTEYFRLKIPELDQIEFALWYHDAVYDPKSLINEDDSCKMAYLGGKTLNLSDDFLFNVSRYIRATRHDRTPYDIYEAYIMDIDIGIFGKDPGTFDAYEDGIRKEYEFVPIEKYRVKRKEILGRFLFREYIYHTQFFQDMYEIEARKNLKRAIDSFLPIKPKENTDVE